MREVDAGDELALHVTFYTILPFYAILTPQWCTEDFTCPPADLVGSWCAYHILPRDDRNSILQIPHILVMIPLKMLLTIR